jgi:uncharacterized protein (TIGR03437 family)
MLSLRVLTAAILCTSPGLAQLSVVGAQQLKPGMDDLLPHGADGSAFTSSLAAGDFNGDGFADLALGAPLSENFGALAVVHGGIGGLSAKGAQTWRQGENGIEGNREEEDLFGFAVAAGDFDGDGFADLAVSAPGEDERRGIIHVLYGSTSGLTSTRAQAWRQGHDGIRDSAEDGDLFGYSLTAADFDGDGFVDLAAGAPGEDERRGALAVLYGSNRGLTSDRDEYWREGRDGLRGSGSVNDSFGFELASGDFNGDGYPDLVTGVPGENSGKGTVNLILGSPGGLTSNGNVRREQGSDGVPDTAEDDDGFGSSLAAGDFDGDGFDDLAVGAPAEDEARGLIIVIPGSAQGLTGFGSLAWREGENGLPGDGREEENRFGGELAAGDYNQDGFGDLAFTSPGESGGGGVVQVIYGSSEGLSAAGIAILSQGPNGLGDRVEEGDQFGLAMATGDFGLDDADDLAIGAPGEDAGRGAVHAVFGQSLIPSPSIAAVVGAGLSIPLVERISHGAIVTIFGANFQPAAPAAAPAAALPTNLGSVCVEIGGRRAPIFALFPQQINAQADIAPGSSSAPVRVIIGCDTANEISSRNFIVPVVPATPEFFFFVNGANGRNPIAAVNETTRALVGEPGLIPGVSLEPARSGEVVTVYGTGFGETNPSVQPGDLATGPAPVVSPVSVRAGDVEVPTIYAGLSPGFAGLYQISFRIPPIANAGDLAVQVSLPGAETPAGGFLSVRP